MERRQWRERWEREDGRKVEVVRGSRHTVTLVVKQANMEHADVTVRRENVSFLRSNVFFRGLWSCAEILAGDAQVLGGCVKQLPSTKKMFAFPTKHL